MKANNMTPTNKTRTSINLQTSILSQVQSKGKTEGYTTTNALFTHLANTYLEIEEIALPNTFEKSMKMVAQDTEIQNWQEKGLISLSSDYNTILRESTKLSLWTKSGEFRRMTEYIVNQCIQSNTALVMSAFTNKTKVATIFFRYFNQSIDIVEQLEKLAIKGLLYIGDFTPINSIDTVDLVQMMSEGLSITKTEKYSINLKSLIATVPYKSRIRKAHFTTLLTHIAKMRVNAHKAYYELLNLSNGKIAKLDDKETNLNESVQNAIETINSMDESEEMTELMINNLNTFIDLISNHSEEIMNKRKCTECEHTISTSAVFCEKCGQKQ